MGLERGKPRQLLPVAKVETVYLDMQSRPTTPESAVRVIAREYDAKGNYVGASVSIDFSKAQQVL